MDNITPNKQTAAVCGLFCKSCGIYIATQANNTDQLNRIADRLGFPRDQVRCDGCRTDVNSAYCKTCNLKTCASKKGVEFCSQCNEYPCSQLKDFQSQLPHRAELFQSLDRIKEVGWEKWYVEMAERLSCTKCNQLSGWYDFACSNCGNKPSSHFVADNFEKLSTFKR
ncbi:MAG TPA: hypothetical protein DIW31_11040 [Bacteroidales bacterium]|nr:hypothetical protein [Bacteroidales bacterium]